MLPRAERIGTTEFRRAFDSGRVLRGGLLQLRIYRRDNAGHENTGRAAIEYSNDAAGCGNRQTRAAFVVSRKSGKATVRNSLRRRVREIYRLSAWRHDARLAGTDLLFFASSTALTAPNEALQRALNELLERAARSQQGARPIRNEDFGGHKFRCPAATTTSASSSSPASHGRNQAGKSVREEPAPDASAPDASAPDASAPDASAPDASAPDASAPDAPPDTGN